MKLTINCILLVVKSCFPVCFLKPGTPAARMKKVPSAVVKKRSRELTSIFEAFTPYNGMEGRVERIWINEIATDGIHLVRLCENVAEFIGKFIYLVLWC